MSTNQQIILETNTIFKTYSKTAALRGVDIQIRQGEVVAIMGPSGSGKSTLLHCMAGIIRPTSGTVIYDGAPISTYSESKRSLLRRSDFGFVFQFGQLLPELTALDNVSVPLLLQGKSRKQAEATGMKWLAAFGLAGKEQKLPSELSGGQAQRVAIARAMAAEPKILFADEPTGSLDSVSAEAVMKIMVSVAKKSGTTVVIITHDARTAAYADREMIVRDGKLSGPGKETV